MYPIKENTKQISGEKVTTYERDIINACCAEVEVGTNGYKGGDTGHGSRTYLRFEANCGSDINVTRIAANRNSDGGFIIELGGDAELFNLLKGLKFAVKVLEEQVNEVFD